MPCEISEGIYWVGAVDYDVRHFHGYAYETMRGTTYNAYLVVGEKVALVDTVLKGFGPELLRHIAEIVDPTRIDYLIANHGEPDHAGEIEAVMNAAPRATLVYSKRGAASIGKYHPGPWQVRAVVTGETLDLGGKTLTFVEAPMLHWPDSMFTYVSPNGALLPNDAFGQHIATANRFADEIHQADLWDEATKYYANILTPFSSFVITKVAELQKLGVPVNVIGPSHGVIWRKDPMQIVNKYLAWAKGETRDKVVVVYETMWGSTAALAKSIVEGIAESGMEACLLRIPVDSLTRVLGELLEARGIIVGSCTHNRKALMGTASLLDDLAGLRFQGKKGAAFGSHGWGGGATKQIEEGLKEAGIEVVQDCLTVSWAPNAQELDRARAFGSEFVAKLRQGA
jgi:flavorubredoxin